MDIAIPCDCYVDVCTHPPMDPPEPTTERTHHELHQPTSPAGMLQLPARGDRPQAGHGARGHQAPQGAHPLPTPRRGTSGHAMRTPTKLVTAGALAAALAAGPTATAWATQAPINPTVGSTSLFGATGELVHLNAPISGGAVDSAAFGAYWLVGADGGVFAFGGAPYLGSLPSLGITPAAPIVGIVPTPHDNGYWLVGADGGVFAFGSAPFLGSAPSEGVAPIGPITLAPIVEQACGASVLTGYRLSWGAGSIGWTHGVMCGAASGTGPVTSSTGTSVTGTARP